MALDANQKSVLVVDDQENWRNLLARLLKNELTVDTAGSLEEAWQKILEKKGPPYHVLVTDIRLLDSQVGNEDGLRLVEMLNRLGEKTKVIVVTGYPTYGTVKRAYGSLDVTDYLEKAPQSGEDFDTEAFRNVVCSAAIDAEKSRPAGFTLDRRWILLIGEKSSWREKLEHVLKDQFYDVDPLETAQNLASHLHLHHEEKKYQLVIFHDTVAEKQDDFYVTLQKYLPDVKKIMFTDQNIEPVVRLMQEKFILNIFTIQDGQYNKRAFEETLRRAFAPEATRYALATICDEKSPGHSLADSDPLVVGHRYLLELSLQNDRRPGAIAVWMTPSPEKKERVHFKVFIYAPNFALDPDAEAYWEIPVSGMMRPYITRIEPTQPETITLSIELEQDNGWAWRITKKLQVIKPKQDPS